MPFDRCELFGAVILTCMTASRHRLCVLRLVDRSFASPNQAPQIPCMLIVWLPCLQHGGANLCTPKCDI